MRRLALLAAAVPLRLARPALAADKKEQRPSICRAPDLELLYDQATFTASVSLPVSGCAGLMAETFPAWISRGRAIVRSRGLRPRQRSRELQDARASVDDGPAGRVGAQR